MEANGGTRTTDAILRSALTELMDREQRLEAFVEEHKAVRHAIGTIEKALKPTRRASTRTGAPPGGNGDSPRAKAIARIATVLRESFDPIPLEVVAERTGLKNGPWLAGLLKQMVGSGEAAEVPDGKYGVPAPAVAAME